MNDDTMSVDEWLQAFFMAATCDGATFVGNEEVGIAEIKRELRKAVIREAQVGTVHLKLNTILCISHCDGPDGKSPLEWNAFKDGPYFIIPKEVKQVEGK